MCGISGLRYFDGTKPDYEVLTSMNEAIVHRGPDSGAIEVMGNTGLTHRRLSIIDLSNAANQPFQSANGRFTLVYNGEVYNFKELKKELINEGYSFRTTSDTEVILTAFEAYGTKAFEQFNGMFALAIYDKEKEELILARDPFGIKPLYIYKDNRVLAFGSEMKAILKVPNIELSISKQALSEYLWYGNPLGSNTIYEQIQELGAGTYSVVNHKSIESFRYYNPFQHKPTAATDNMVSRTREELQAAVERHLVSDVPVGIFLSGGIDSSAITALASRKSAAPLNSYSVSFGFDSINNELSLAAKVARQFGTKHNEVEISGSDVIQVIEALVEAHDEPFGDAADIPLFMLTKKLKGQIKVVLQGDGGDEFFGGYSRYNTLSKVFFWKLFCPFVPLLMKISLKNTRWMRFQRFIFAITRKEAWYRHALLLTMESRKTNPLQVLQPKLQQELKQYDPFKRYREVYSEIPPEISDVDALFLADTQVILKDTFFEKVDKSTMANSMEVRVPFIDKELTDWCLSVAASEKIKNGEPKGLLKRALRGVVPNAILDGKKKGFGVPYAKWLKGPLRSYFMEQISTDKARVLLDVEHVKMLMELHCQNKGNYGFLLWKTLILSIWLNKSKI